jgi:hypothetical protein
MDNTNNQKWIYARGITFLLLGMLIVYFSVTTLVEKRFQEIEQNTRQQISQQMTLLAVIAEATARNGADAVTESIVRDCPVSERSKFDDLLGRLDSGLNFSQLTELDRLFGRCGSFYSERKLVMVARLAREIEVYENYVNQLSVITGDDLSPEFKLEEWKSLAEAENKLSGLFAQLVISQDKIIGTLLEGKSPSSPEIAQILHEVGQVQETLTVTNTQTSNLRSRLISL